HRRHARSLAAIALGVLPPPGTPALDVMVRRLAGEEREPAHRLHSFSRAGAAEGVEEVQCAACVAEAIESACEGNAGVEFTRLVEGAHEGGDGLPITGGTESRSQLRASLLVVLLVEGSDEGRA